VLSRDTHLTNPDLISMCLLSIPLKAPPNFAIFPVPPVLSSWVTSLLRSQPLIMVSAKAPTRSSVWLGLVGDSGSRASTSLMTNTPRPSSTAPGLASLAPSSPLSEPADDRLAAGTVTGSVDHVAAPFADPRHSDAGASSRFLQRIYKSYRDGDDNLKQQKAVTASLLSHMFAHAQLPFSSPVDRAVAELAIGAFFFAMRSCEYVHVSGSRCTKPLCLRNLRFFRDNRVLLHSDPNLASATALTITFEYQKTDVRDETVHQHSTGLPILCPVRRWAGIVQHILSYPGCNADSPISTVVANDTRKLVTGTFLATQLRAAASRIVEDTLGFSPEDIGTHSIQSEAVMAMYLAGVPVFTIMLIGRWSSDAFLRYIRRQVLQFSSGVASRMVCAHTQNFFTLPDFFPENQRTCTHRTNFISPPHSGPTKSQSTPDHIYESHFPRFKLTI
jgi:hypothetical protein